MIVIKEVRNYGKIVFIKNSVERVRWGDASFHAEIVITTTACLFAKTYSDLSRTPATTSPNPWGSVEPSLRTTALESRWLNAFPNSINKYTCRQVSPTFSFMFRGKKSTSSNKLCEVQPLSVSKLYKMLGSAEATAFFFTQKHVKKVTKQPTNSKVCLTGNLLFLKV